MKSGSRLLFGTANSVRKHGTWCAGAARCAGRGAHSARWLVRLARCGLWAGVEGGSHETALSTSAVWYRVLAKMRKVALNFPSAWT